MKEAKTPVVTHPESYWKKIREQYPIEEGVTYLNNGSFGPCPTPVIEAAITYYRTLETNPQRYLHEYRSIIEREKALLASFVGAEPGELVFITNVTVGMNMIANGLSVLRDGDEILLTSQEYGAVRNTWDYIAGRRGAALVTVELPTPPDSPEDIVERILAACTAKTRVIAMSHITSPTGMILPVAEICRKAAERGILTAIDGAHVPGMIPLDIGSIGCDFYTGNCHKWLGAPKGSGFLYARSDRQKLLDPLVVGWGWKRGEESFIGNFENPGTNNPSMYLATGEAIRFQEAIGTDEIRARGFELASYFRTRIREIPGARLLTSTEPELSGSLTSVELAGNDGTKLHAEFAARKIVLPGIGGGEKPRIRISTHIYNTIEEIDSALDVIRETLVDR